MEKLGGGKRERAVKRVKGREIEKRKREMERDKNGIKKLNMRIRILVSYNFYHLIIDLY